MCNLFIFEGFFIVFNYLILLEILLNLLLVIFKYFCYIFKGFLEGKIIVREGGRRELRVESFKGSYNSERK